jgi:DNA processing protein
MSLAEAKQPPIEQLFTENEKISWLRLFRTENVGPVTFYKLLERYGSAAKALDALPELSKREIDALEKIGGKFLFARDKNYPVSLAAIEDAPPVISIFGNPGFFRKSAIGIVGARNASLNGKKFAEKLSRELGQSGQMSRARN